MTFSQGWFVKNDLKNEAQQNTIYRKRALPMCLEKNRHSKLYKQLLQSLQKSFLLH